MKLGRLGGRARERGARVLDRGASIIETVLVAAIILIAVLSAFSAFGSALRRALGAIDKCIDKLTTPEACKDKPPAGVPTGAPSSSAPPRPSGTGSGAPRPSATTAPSGAPSLDTRARTAPAPSGTGAPQARNDTKPPGGGGDKPAGGGGDKPAGGGGDKPAGGGGGGDKPAGGGGGSKPAGGGGGGDKSAGGGGADKAGGAGAGADKAGGAGAAKPTPAAGDKAAGAGGGADKAGGATPKAEDPKGKPVLDKAKNCGSLLAKNLNKTPDQVGKCPNEPADFTGRLLTEVQQGIGGLPKMSDADMAGIANQCSLTGTDINQMACATAAVGKKLEGYDAQHEAAALGTVLSKMGISSTPMCNGNTTYNQTQLDNSTQIASAIAQCVVAF